MEVLKKTKREVQVKPQWVELEEEDVIFGKPSTIHQRLRRAQEKGHFWIHVNSQQEVSDHIHIITHF